MAKAKFAFTYNDTEFMLWAWKGDYTFLGAGAELGIYYGGGPLWACYTDSTIHMALYLKYGNELIVKYTPSQKQWWVTGFNPHYQSVSAGDLTAVFTLRFADADMFQAFYNTWNGKDARWSFDTVWHIATFTF